MSEPTVSPTALDLRRPLRQPRTASRTFSGETVIISPAENTVRMLNAVASRIWELCDGSRTLAEIAVILTEEFEVDLAHAQRSVAEFVDEMQSKQLLIWAE
jgi:pyrroloquinoline quinone biosynthesis protein D